MRTYRLPLRATPITVATTLMAMGIALGCDVEDDLSPEDVELLEADVDEESDEEEHDQDHLGVGAADELTAEIGPVAYSWLPWHSEETAGVSSCGTNIVTAFDCEGSFCDNVRLQCHDFGGATPTISFWSPWFEDSGTTHYSCPLGSVMNAIDCDGSYCDNIKIRCAITNQLTYNCEWTGDWYSEENIGSFSASSDGHEVIQGIQCSGTHCDNKKFHICDI